MASGARLSRCSGPDFWFPFYHQVEVRQVEAARRTAWHNMLDPKQLTVRHLSSVELEAVSSFLAANVDAFAQGLIAPTTLQAERSRPPPPTLTRARAPPRRSPRASAAPVPHVHARGRRCSAAPQCASSTRTPSTSPPPRDARWAQPNPSPHKAPARPPNNPKLSPTPTPTPTRPPPGLRAAPEPPRLVRGRQASLPARPAVRPLHGGAAGARSSLSPDPARSRPISPDLA